MPALPHRLDRTIVIDAPPEAVYEFFTDNERWASWWGAGSTIDPTPGGRVYIRYPNGVEVMGAVVEAKAPDRISFTYGFASGKPIGPGESLVTIRLEPHGGATALSLSHEFSEAAPRDQHVQGWRYQLSVFSNVVTDHLHRDAAALVDRWFEAWSMTDASARTTALAAIAASDVAFRDRFSLVNGLEDLSPHIGAYQHFMPGMRIARAGDVRHCQGTVLAEWQATGPDDQPRGAGTNVFRLGPDGKIADVTGLWNT